MNVHHHTLIRRLIKEVRELRETIDDIHAAYDRQRARLKSQAADAYLHAQQVETELAESRRHLAGMREAARRLRRAQEWGDDWEAERALRNLHRL